MWTIEVQDRWESPRRPTGGKGVEGGGCTDQRWRGGPWRETRRPYLALHCGGGGETNLPQRYEREVELMGGVK